MAYVFHFPPSELWAMSVDELRFWLDRATWIDKVKKQQRHG